MLSGSLRARERARLEDFLSDLELCPHDLSHWFRVGKFREELRRAGLSVSTPDAHVARCALECDGLLLTEDSVFAKIARAKRLRLATIGTSAECLFAGFRRWAALPFGRLPGQPGFNGQELLKDMELGTCGEGY